MASMVVFSDSTWPRTVLRSLCLENSIMCFINSQPTPWPLSRERTRMANSAFSSACVIVQAHHAQHLLALVVDGNEGHGAGRIVVDELVEQVVAHFAHRREEAQPQVLRCHVAEKIAIEGSILRDKPADQNRRSIAQG